MLPAEGAAAGALDRTPPQDPHLRGGSSRRARPYAARDPHQRGQQPARSAVRRTRPPPEGEQASRPALYMQVKSR